jgi:hypothetical protein
VSFKIVTLENLKALDMGKVDEAFKAHLALASLDCADRPAEKKARKVMVELSIVPVPETNGQMVTCSEVKAKFRVTSSVPKHETKEYSFGVKKTGALVFNEDAPDNVNQATLLDDK